MSPPTEALHSVADTAPGHRWSRRLQRARRQTLLLRPDAAWDAGHAGAPRRPAERHDDFDAWCRAHPASRCELQVSGMLVHDLVCDPSLPLDGDAQLLQHAQAVFTHYHGEVAARWRLAVWSCGAQRGVSALHGLDLTQLQASAARCGVRIDAVMPWWARVLALARRRLPALASTADAWLLVVESRFVTALRLQHGDLVAIHAQWIEDPSPQALGACALQLFEAQREPAVGIAVGDGIEPGEVPGVHVLGRLDRGDPACEWLLMREWQA